MITTLRPGRTKALIQRKHRKAHVASTAPGEQWLTACSREVLIGGTEFALLDQAIELIDDCDLCKRCAELYATADHFYDAGYAAGFAAGNAAGIRSAQVAR